MKHSITVDDKFAAARLTATEKYPFLAHALWSMVPVAVNANITMAVDTRWRVYYAPDSPWYQEHDARGLAAVLVHETAHLLREHHKRSEELGVETQGDEGKYQCEMANIAQDAYINDDLLRDGILTPLPGEPVTSKSEELPPNLTWEEGFALLMARPRPPEPPRGGKGQKQGQGAGEGEGDGDGSGEGEGENQGAGGDAEGDKDSGEGQKPGGFSNNSCGSGATGKQEPWELPADSNAPGVSNTESDLVKRAVAQAIQEHTKSRGTTPGNWERWAAETLKVKVDPRREIRAVVAKTTNEIAAGKDNRSYRKVHRRQALFGDLIKPGKTGFAPRVCVVADTSGSMSNDQLRSAMDCVKNALRECGQVEFISGDTHVASDQHLRSIKQAKLAGGGGTDMSAIMEDINARPRRDLPDLVIVVTDTWTPWPAERMHYKTLIVALSSGYQELPAWAKVLDLSEADWS